MKIFSNGNVGFYQSLKWENVASNSDFIILLLMKI